VTSILRLGEPNGLLVIMDETEWYCFYSLRLAEMIPVSFDEGSPNGNMCHIVGSAIKQRILDQNDKIEWMLGFGQTLYYALKNMKGEVLKLTIENVNVKMNPRYDQPNIDKWVEQYMKDSHLTAVELVRKTNDRPRFPSLIRVLDDNRLGRVFKLATVDPKNYKKSTGFQVGHTYHLIDSMYLEHRKLVEYMMPVIFFDRYYSKIALYLGKRNSFTKPEPFPILVSVWATVLYSL